MAKRLVGFASVVACVLFATSSYAQVIRQGVEFQVNLSTVNNQHVPSLAVDADGDFVVTWSDDVKEVNGNRGIWGNRFSSTGALLFGEFHVNTYTTSNQHHSSVAAEANGDFVVVWESFSQVVAGNYTIFGQRFNSSGGPVGAEFQVNTYTGYTYRPRVASDSDGDFVVVWDSSGQDGSFRGIFGRRFNSSGAALATEFMVNSFTVTNQRFPSVALDSDGDFVVVWDSFNNHDGQAYGIFAQRFNSTGAPVGIEFQINSYTSNSQAVPAVTADADGDFIVAWQSTGQDGDVLGVFARRFNSAGIGQAAEFRVANRTVGDQRYPAISADDSGDFIVTWESALQDGSNFGVFARRFGAAGPAIGFEFQVSTYTFDDQQRPVVDWDSEGDFVIAWYSELQDPGSGIFAQRFSLPPVATLDVDGDGILGPLTDGLLILRHFFGFSGTTLTNAAVGANCSRCDSATIAPYITGLGSLLDINDSGNLSALTDGLLIVRFLFGFTGTTLTNGAVGTCGTRCDAATILPYLQTLD